MAKDIYNIMKRIIKKILQENFEWADSIIPGPVFVGAQYRTKTEAILTVDKVDGYGDELVWMTGEDYFGTFPNRMSYSVLLNYIDKGEYVPLN